METSPTSPFHLAPFALSPTHCALHFSLCLLFVEFKKSYENDSQSSDNINFLHVGWSNKQLTTLKPLLSEIEYLQDQHLLLTVKSLDGYESYGMMRVFKFTFSLTNSSFFQSNKQPFFLFFLGECVLALKSMIGSTAQQFHTYLFHRGEETGNIRGSMRVRVPSERMGTRERLYGNYVLKACFVQTGTPVSLKKTVFLKREEGKCQ